MSVLRASNAGRSKAFTIRATAVAKSMTYVLSVLIACCQLQAENKTLKRELEQALVGKTVVSRILLGGRAVPRGYEADYPVNTEVDSDTGEIGYRVEWAFMRTGVEGGEIVRSFEIGSSFRVSGVSLKDDRIELKLKKVNGDSANLKVLLGKGWQSRLDADTVQIKLGRFLTLNPQPGQAKTDYAAPEEPSQPTAPAPLISNARPDPAIPPPDNPGSSLDATKPDERQQPVPPLQLQPDTMSATASAEPQKTIEFGDVPLGTTPEVVQKFNNAGSTPLTFSSIAIVDDTDASFSQTNDCGSGLETGTQCAVTVTFAPQATGEHSASLVVTIPSQEPLIYPLEGNGTSGAANVPEPAYAPQLSTTPPSTEKSSDLLRFSLWTWLIGISAFALLLLARAAHKRAQAKKAAIWKERKRAEEEEEKEQRRERAKIRTENKEFFDQIFDLIVFCRAPVTEIRLKAEAAGSSADIPKSKLLVVDDAVSILAAFRDTDSSDYIYNLWFVLKDHFPKNLFVRPLFALDSCVMQLGMILFLAEYDKQNETNLVSRAASTYMSIVSVVASHCDRSVPAKAVVNAYFKLLRPYIHEAGRDEKAWRSRSSSSSKSQPASACEKCMKDFELLGLPVDSSKDEIGQKRRDCADVLHPDKLGGKSERARNAAEQQLKIINAACDRLLSCKCARSTS